MPSCNMCIIWPFIVKGPKILDQSGFRFCCDVLPKSFNVTGPLKKSSSLAFKKRFGQSIFFQLAWSECPHCSTVLSWKQQILHDGAPLDLHLLLPYSDWLSGLGGGGSAQTKEASLSWQKAHLKFNTKKLYNEVSNLLCVCYSRKLQVSYWWVKFDSCNQKHYRYLGSTASLVLQKNKK